MAKKSKKKFKNWGKKQIIFLEIYYKHIDVYKNHFFNKKVLFWGEKAKKK